MRTAALCEKPALQAVAASSLPVLAALFLLWHEACHAGQGSGQFPVTINFQNASAPAASQPGAPPSILCRSGTMVGSFGSTVTVICATGVTGSAGSGSYSQLPWTSMPDNTYRFMLTSYREGEQLRASESFYAAGTDATWRTIKLNDRDYIEMMLHW